MKRITLIALVALSSVPFAATYAQTYNDRDQDRTHPKTFVKDSAITAKIKASLAAQHISNLVHIRVDTDEHGVVWLSGKAKTQDAIDAAVAVARATEGVQDVHSSIRITTDK
jgi:hyperosmotically inducible periplasmic protein